MGIIDYDPEKTANEPNFETSTTRSKLMFSTNRYKLMYFEKIDIFETLKEYLFVNILRRQSENVSVSAGVYQTTRQRQQVCTYGRQSSRGPFACQGQSPEPVYQIVGQENQMEVNLVGQEAVGWDTAQRQTSFEFANVQFASCSFLVVIPDGRRLQWKIADHHVITIIFQIPESQLRLLLLALRTWPTDNEELMWLLPIVWLVGKLCGLPRTILSEGTIVDLVSCL